MSETLYDFCPCYCEENIYLAIRKDPEKWPFVVFISNSIQQVSFGKQFISDFDDDTVIWDYHVIASNPKTHVILDLNCSLGPAIDWNTYNKNVLVESLFDSGNKTNPRKYRIIPSNEYKLSSDRSHMQFTSSQGTISWLSPPPDWAPIFDSKIGNNLQSMIDMSITSSQSLGSVLSEDDFAKFMSD